MRKYRKSNVVPPSGYTYTVAVTGASFLAGDHDSLVNRVRLHYVTNNLPVPADLSARIENAICLQNPESFCTGEYEQGAEQAVVASTAAMREATAHVSTRLKWGLGDFLASQEEADRRASICATCKDNSRATCTTCNGLKEYVIKAVGSRSTPYDSGLGVCTHCLCLLTVKIHISAAALRVAAGNTPESIEADRAKYPAGCWLQSVLKKIDVPGGAENKRKIST